MTLSGGDLFCQTDFAEALLEACDDACINAAAELDMFTSFENVKRIVPHLQMFYVDVKTMDPEKHKKWTGQDNACILENIPQSRCDLRAAFDSCPCAAGRRSQ